MDSLKISRKSHFLICYSNYKNTSKSRLKICEFFRLYICKKAKFCALSVFFWAQKTSNLCARILNQFLSSLNRAYQIASRSKARLRSDIDVINAPNKTRTFLFWHFFILDPRYSYRRQWDDHFDTKFLYQSNTKKKL